MESVANRIGAEYRSNIDQYAPGPGQHWWPGAPSTDRAQLRIDEQSFGWMEIPARRSSTYQLEQYSPSLVQTEDELESAVQLRRESYGKHGRALTIKSDADDRLATTAVFIVRDLDGEIFATMRVCFCLSDQTDWAERFSLPSSFRRARLSAFERLAIRGGGLRAARAKQALFKAAYLLSLGVGTDWIMISTIAPLNRLFESLGFFNIYGKAHKVTVNWYREPVFVLAMKSSDYGQSLLAANRVWYDHIVTPDPSIDATLATYFEALGQTEPPSGKVGVRSFPLIV